MKDRETSGRIGDPTSHVRAVLIPEPKHLHYASGISWWTRVQAIYLLMFFFQDTWLLFDRKLTSWHALQSGLLCVQGLIYAQGGMLTAS